jgi:ribosomal protein S18 acetylase RimI-like enzyme
MIMSFEVRPLKESDLDDLLIVQRAAYGDIYIETKEIFLTKLLVSNETCLAGFKDGRLAGYCIGFNWQSGLAVPLHSDIREIQHEENAFYIHDIAIHPDFEGQGLATTLMNLSIENARERGFKSVELTAVQSAATYWERFGYKPMAEAEGGYGAEAMRYQLILQ